MHLLLASRYCQVTSRFTQSYHGAIRTTRRSARSSEAATAVSTSGLTSSGPTAAAPNIGLVHVAAHPRTCWSPTDILQIARWFNALGARLPFFKTNRSRGLIEAFSFLFPFSMGSRGLSPHRPRNLHAPNGQSCSHAHFNASRCPSSGQQTHPRPPPAKDVLRPRQPLDGPEPTQQHGSTFSAARIIAHTFHNLSVSRPI